MRVSPLILTEKDVRAVLPMADLIDVMQGALGAFSAGRVAQPVRTVLEVGSDRNFFGVMPAAVSDPPALGAKLVTVYHRNHERGLPSHLATIVLLDPATGSPDAVLDGRFITEARTAAVSAVSVRLLARAEASVLALIGSGVQAGSHLDAIGRVRSLTDVRVWSPSRERRDAFARARSAGAGVAGSASTPGATTATAAVPVRAVESARDAVSGADIIVLATSAREPVIADADVRAGAHICAVGACRPDQREMPAALIARARVFVDSRAAALAEAGDLLLAIAEGAITDRIIAGELGELATGRIVGRRSPEDVTIFKSLGMAAEDVVAAQLAVARARAGHLGQPFRFD